MQLGMAFAGAALGSFAGPLGAQIGWIAGSVAGSLLFGQKAQKEPMQDLKVSTSTYGKGIPIVYGSMRPATNMIWATDLVKKKKGKKAGKGKGGMSGKKGGDSYEYFGNWASAICEGPVDKVTRVWADGKLIYSEISEEAANIYRQNKKKKKKAFGVFPKSGGSSATLRPFAVYYGTEEQLPDPTIEMYEGVGNTPAYRGLCYLVFSNFALEEWGNRIPSITAEVMVNTSREASIPPDQKFSVKLPSQSLIAQAGRSIQREDGFHMDHARGVTYEWVPSPTVPLRHVLRVFDTVTGEIRRIEETEILEGELFVPDEDMAVDGGVANLNRIDALVGVLPTGDLLMRTGPVMVVVSSTSFLIKGLYRPGNHGFQMPSLRLLNLQPVTSMTNDGRFLLVSETGTFNNVQCCACENGTIKHLGSATVDFAPGQIGFRPEAIAAGASVGDELSIDVFATCRNLPGFAAGGGPGSTTATLSRLKIRYIQRKNLDDAYEWAAVFEDLEVLKSDVIAHVNAAVDRDPTLLVINSGATVMVFPNAELFSNPGAYGALHVTTVNAETGAVEWFAGFPTGYEYLNGDLNVAAAGPISSGLVGFSSAGGMFEINANDRTIYQSSQTYDPAKGGILGGQYWSEGQFRAYGFNEGSHGYTQFNEILDSIKGRISEVVRDVCERVGLEEWEVNTSELDQIDVPGIIIDNPIEARSFIEMLARAFLFDGVETDGRIKWISRGNAPVLTITKDQLCPVDEETNAVFKETIVQALDLPQFVTVTHADPGQDYNTGTQHAKRALNPLPAMHSRGTVDMTLPMAMSTDQAKQTAEKVLFSAWQENKTRETKAPWTFAYLDPTDVVTFDIDGFTYQDRLIKADFGANFELSFQSTQQVPGTYSSTARGSSTNGSPVSEYQPLPFLRAFVVDAPMLHDSDNPGVGNLRFRVLVLPNKPGFVGCVGTVTIDDLDAGDYQTVFDPTPWGNVVGTIEPPPYGPFAIDDVTLITLRPTYLEEADWVSVGEAEWRAGANAVYAGGELIFFRDATVNGDGSVTLKHLLRGRRGTDYACYPGFHRRNEDIVQIVPSLDASVEVTVPLQQIGSTGKVTLSFPTDGAGAQTSDRFTITNMSVRPLPPAALTRSESAGSLVFTWTYQARFGGEGLRDGTDVVPFTEPNVLYEFYVLSAPYNPKAAGLRRPESYLRKYEVSSAAVTYFAVDMFTDGVSPTDDVHVVVFQVSDLGGLGLPLFQTTRA